MRVYYSQALLQNSRGFDAQFRPSSTAAAAMNPIPVLASSCPSAFMPCCSLTRSNNRERLVDLEFGFGTAFATFVDHINLDTAVGVLVRIKKS